MGVLLNYLLVVLIWGTTWIAVKFQLGEADPAISIFYRFVVASALLAIYSISQKVSFKFTLQDHFFLFLLGAGMFSFHTLFIYKASAYLVSGLVCLLFSLVSLFNIWNAYLFFRTIPKLPVLLGAFTGISGIFIFFSEELLHFSFGSHTFYGICLTLLGAYVFSLGNIVGKRNQKYNFPLLSSTAIAMAYGALIMFVYALVMGLSFPLPQSFSYWIALLYLAIPGSIVAFLCYLTLLAQIGPERAGYSAILFPIIALLISIGFENYIPTYNDLLGMILILAGNILVMYKPKSIDQKA